MENNRNRRYNQLNKIDTQGINLKKQFAPRDKGKTRQEIETVTGTVDKAFNKI